MLFTLTKSFQGPARQARPPVISRDPGRLRGASSCQGCIPEEVGIGWKLLATLYSGSRVRVEGRSIETTLLLSHGSEFDYKIFL